MGDVSVDESVLLPKTSIPIVLIGGGEIARYAHLPAYQKAGFKVRAIYDNDIARAKAVSRDFGIERVARSLGEAIDLAGPSSVFDLAIPPEESLRTLAELPQGSAVLIQKPMGKTLDEARAIRDVCQSNRFKAAVNFQLRFSPMVSAARRLIADGYIGELYNIDVRTIAYSPFLIWSEIQQKERIAILYYAIHYFDMIRSFMGNPKELYARTVNHRQGGASAATRSYTVFDYGDSRIASVVTSHHRELDPRHQSGYMRWEGDQGMIQACFQPNYYSPETAPDVLEFCRIREGRPTDWTSVRLKGRWVPDAFIGSMASLMRVIEGSSSELPTSVEDAFKTMSLIETAYQSNDSGATQKVG